MSLLLRIEMILIAIVVISVVIYSVNRKKMLIQYSLIWVFLSLILLLIAFFPGLVFFLCSVLDIETPSNLIYLGGIVILLLISFSQTIIISKQSERIKSLIQTVSLENYKREHPDEKN